MNRTERHAAREQARVRLGMTTAVAVLVALTVIAVGVLAARPAASGATALASPRLTPSGSAARPAAGVAAGTAAAAVPSLTGFGASLPRLSATPAVPAAPAAASAAQPAVSLLLTAADHRDCPAAAAACVDLARHITWLQAHGRVTFGPVQMEPGKPGGAHQTPRGTFHVSWKAGRDFMSTEYNEPMPWATFFAPGGIAFHGGPLNQWSHGCVHLTAHNAHYYNEHLPVGAEVVVF